jgi:hypothetical protein
VFPERLSGFVDVNGPETLDALWALWRPVHPSEFRPVIDGVSAGALDHSACNTLAASQTDFVPYVLPFSAQVVKAYEGRGDVKNQLEERKYKFRCDKTRRH